MPSLFSAVGNKTIEERTAMAEDYHARLEENAWVLADMKANGVDLSKERIIDFAHVFNNKAAAQSFVDAVVARGLVAEFDLIDSGEYDVIVSLRLKPNLNEITVHESDLGKLARSFHGHADGWGFINDDNVGSH
ncbi:hypothetical protein GOZ78_10000 [Agrobacterium vitis]|uniref:Regulator of ribonuclease activity B domain-containing protein n=2 Tax=Agrobacterium vitis TaxID=373 RepID=A0ABD6G4L9_AGRVI|nr:hypothetical protein [Agrobacterium vitis]MUO94248.1 hypothetical protein [Agrobacterium vitis]MUP03297.1 hypothetical protein [Agrobacterium vitis]MUZ84412.1 hypothetical protein [Agrobacterium vitis]MVA10364.1 hypothetical protein [Agrobacterium vitis]